MTVTAVNPIRGIADALRPIPAPRPVAPDTFMPLPGPVANDGIVPPWLEGIDIDPALWNPGKPIAPDDPDTPVIMDNGNPGIVPPWLQ